MSGRDYNETEFEVQLAGRTLRLRKVTEFDPMELEVCKPVLVKVWSYSQLKSVYRSIHRDMFDRVTEKEVQEA